MSILDEPKPRMSRLPLEGLSKQKHDIYVASVDESSIEMFPENKTDQSYKVIEEDAYKDAAQRKKTANYQPKSHSQTMKKWTIPSVSKMSSNQPFVVEDEVAPPQVYHKKKIISKRNTRKSPMQGTVKY